MKKRVFSLLLCLLLLPGSFAGCGPAPAESQPESEPVIEDSWDGTDYTLEIGEGERQLILYWTNPDGGYKTSDVWIWLPDENGRIEDFHRCEYGVKMVVNVPEHTEKVGFIVRRSSSWTDRTAWGNCTKDVESDRFAVLTGRVTEIWLKAGDPVQYSSRDGGKTLESLKSFDMATIDAMDLITLHITPADYVPAAEDLSLFCEGSELPFSYDPATRTLRTEAPLDLGKTVTVRAEGLGEAAAIPYGVFDSEEFVRELTYDGNDLGATVLPDGTRFKLWAPTASAVILNLYEAGNGGEAFAAIPMIYEGKGVWTLTADAPSGTYYTYSVTTALGTQEAVDPYARTAGVNGDRGMVLDLSSTDPDGWMKGQYVELSAYTDAVLWEVHVRDFSNRIASSAYPGKYLAFTETGLVNAAGVPIGIDYLDTLGITHVHLQPIFDFSSVDETTCTDFNWGYDPKNYNVPEGSYSTDPYHGEVRVRELKQLVQALHAKGLGVVMDVVYNHTSDTSSCLNKVVPYYYYRLDGEGNFSNGCGCGNETASERAMFSKYMVDSVLYWMDEYQIDGFRFDLMALHDTDTMQRIEQAVHAKNPSALLYGEGWTGGTSTLPGDRQTTQANAAKLGTTPGAAGSVAVFNDGIRDGLKGSVFNADEAGFINGNVRGRQNVKYGLYGNIGSTAEPDARVINYMSCHDNLTLWDKLKATCPEASDETLLGMNKVGIAVVMVSHGTPFMLAGEEMLRSKDGDENSYKSSDAVNNIDWEALVPASLAMEAHDWYAGLIRLRLASPLLRSQQKVTAAFTDFADSDAFCVLLSGEGDPVFCVFNPTAAPVSVTLDGSWRLVADGVRAGSETLGIFADCEITVPAMSAYIFFK